MTQPRTANRLDRRKARTRAALVAAARALLTSRDPADVSIQEITDAADVGFGSFYNHFASKQELFEAAVTEVIEEHGAMLDEITAALSDPAEVFAASVRMTARFPKTHPEMAKIIERVGQSFLTAPIGLAPRALRDLQLARDAQRFTFGDPDVALACIGGAVLGVVHLGLSHSEPTAIDNAADELAVNLLRMMGLGGDEARAIAERPLPEPR
ncbi:MULTISPECIES: TetR/AcrR family transcriptional regulator [Glycomyces]|uniref:AcrR family transcriptional regulator n=2 Tax=Glycomyces TaxID=58113 RepID=A0A9X3PJM0_9ACTN|nr:TetR family transcriptional regulator [Glycomyces lechevalierae]MDA1386052.1 TetR family transcriptional regulator [Glycomyces lechevalierae]MDR7340790.1 AcrR family transcriptional regulator [Glycomyces lechevalierae]